MAAAIRKRSASIGVSSSPAAYAWLAKIGIGAEAGGRHQTQKEPLALTVHTTKREGLRGYEGSRGLV